MNNSTSTHNGNQTDNIQTCLPSVDNEWAHVFKLTLYLVAMAVSLVGNLLVICVVYRNRRLRTPTNYLITNMAVSDFLMTVVAMTPTALAFISSDLKSWYDGWIGIASCKFLSFAQGTTMAGSIFTLTAIACERFGAIVFPLRSTMRSGNTKWVIIVVWFVSGLVMIPMLFVMTVIKANDDKYYCHEIWKPPLDPVKSQGIYTLVLFILLYIAPLFVISLLYACVIYTVWLRQIPGNTNRSMKKIQRRVRKNVVKMLIIVVVVFTIFWLPMHILQLLLSFSNVFGPCGGPSSLYLASMLLSHSTGAVNFLIYVVFSEDYKQGFKGLFRCCFLFSKKASVRLGQPSVRTEQTTDNRRSTTRKTDMELRRLTSNNDQEEISTPKGTKNVKFESEYSTSA